MERARGESDSIVLSIKNPRAFSPYFQADAVQKILNLHSYFPHDVRESNFPHFLFSMYLSIEGRGYRSLFSFYFLKAFIPLSANQSTPKYEHIERIYAYIQECHQGWYPWAWIAAQQVPIDRCLLHAQGFLNLELQHMHHFDISSKYKTFQY